MLHARKKSERSEAYALWRQMLDQMPTVEPEHVVDVDPEGKTGTLGKRESVGLGTKGYTAETIAEATQLTDRGLEARRRIRMGEQQVVEGQIDGQTTAEKLHRGQAVIVQPPTPEHQIGHLAAQRKEAVRKSRKTVKGRSNTPGGFSELPHQGLWTATPIPKKGDSHVPKRRMKHQVPAGPISGSAVIH